MIYSAAHKTLDQKLWENTMQTTVIIIRNVCW